jgi:hypothetical protein
MKFGGNARFITKAVMVEGRKNKMVHTLASPKVDVQAEFDALANKPLRERRPGRPLRVSWVLINESLDSFPGCGVTCFVIRRHCKSSVSSAGSSR